MSDELAHDFRGRGARNRRQGSASPSASPGSKATNTPVAVICSAHMNAVGIALSLREIGWKGRVLCLREGDGAVAQRFPELCETVPVHWTEPQDLLRILNQLIPPHVIKYLFFTNEIFHPTIAENPQPWIEANCRYHLGSTTHMDTVLDRMAFYRFIDERGLALAPQTLPSDAEPWSRFPQGVRVRIRKSWRGVQRLPRGLNARSQADLESWPQQAEAAGLSPDDWCFQELLSTRPQDNVSVSGWLDETEQVMHTTRKVIQVRDNGRVVERIDDPDRLCDQAAAILAALDYRGPFELEFLWDPRNRVFKVLELNPRFWMQHRLVAALCDNALVRHYIGGDSASVPARDSDHTRVRYWLDTDTVLPALLTPSELKMWKYTRNAVWAQPWRPVLANHLRLERNRLKQKIKSKLNRLTSRLKLRGQARPDVENRRVNHATTTEPARTASDSPPRIEHSSPHQ